MAASLTDKFKKTGTATITTLSSPGKALGATSLTVGSTTNYPSDTGIIIAIRVVDTSGNLVAGTYTEWKATVSSGTSLAIDATPVYGSDQVYAAGSTTQVYIPVSSYAHGQLVDGILAHANQDGTLKANSVGTTQILDGAITNAKLSTTAGEVGGAWLAWTPTFTGVTTAASTVTSVYTRIGKTILFEIAIVFAGGNTPTGNMTFTLPVTAKTKTVVGSYLQLGRCDFEDAGVKSIHGAIRATSTTIGQVLYLAVVGAGIEYGALSAVAPFAWGNGDGMFMRGTYEAA